MQLFELLGDSIEMTLYKGGGKAHGNEVVIDSIPRDADYLDDMHLAVSPKWASAAKENERIRVEGETFAYGALKFLLKGGFEVIHCLEQEVCNVVYAHRHLFGRTPAIVFSNGGAIAAGKLPNCDHVQEHSDHNFSRSAKHKAFVIPHGVDIQKFRPGIRTDFRALHSIPEDALLVISVGSICFNHKRMDHVVREVADVPDAWLLIIGQETKDSPQIKALAKSLMGGRAIFATMAHDELPQAYAAADVFTLGSLFETFGIVYIEAMAMGLPVVCTDHVNQRSIVQEGIFVDMRSSGALASVLKTYGKDDLREIGARGREVAVRNYDLRVLKASYVEQYRKMVDTPRSLPRYGLTNKIRSNMENLVRKTLGR